jgi:hypothetical protein
VAYPLIVTSSGLLYTSRATTNKRAPIAMSSVALRGNAERNERMWSS